MPLGIPAAPMGQPQQPPQMGGQPNPIAAILSVLAGAGWEKFAKGISHLTQSGQDVNQLMSLPNFGLMLAGAGLKDSANSMELVSPLLKSLQPPPPPQNQSDPKKISAALQMLSAKMGDGLQGIAAPMPQGMGPTGF